MKNKKPLVSILIPVYNAEKYIDEAMKSMLTQTYDNIEIIIINDASTDNTEEKILKYKDKRIKYYINTKNIGVTKTLNKGIKYCKGEYVARMDADDISMKNRIEEQVKEMNEYDVVGSNIILINDNGKRIGERKYEKFVDEVILIKSPLAHPTVMIKKHLLNRGYNEKLEAAQDYELWLYLYWKGAQIKNIQKNLLKYRQHKNSMKNKKTKTTIRNTIKAKEIAKKEFGMIFLFKHDIRLLMEKMLLLLPSVIILKLFYLMEGVKK